MSRRVFPENRDDLMDSVITSPPRFQQCIYNVCTFTQLNVRRGHQIPKMLSAKIFIGRKGEEQGGRFGILLPKLFWPTVRKYCSSDREKVLKIEAEGREFSNFLRSLEQFIQTVKGQNNFWYQNACSWMFLISNELEQFKFKLEKNHWDSETYRKS